LLVRVRTGDMVTRTSLQWHVWNSLQRHWIGYRRASVPACCFKRIRQLDSIRLLQHNVRHWRDEPHADVRWRDVRQLQRICFDRLCKLQRRRPISIECLVGLGCVYELHRVVISEPLAVMCGDVRHAVQFNSCARFYAAL